MLTKIIHFLILSLVILLPLVNSHFFGLFGFKELVVDIDGSFEFTKTIFFNIFSGIIVFLFFLKNFNKNIYFPKIILLPILVLFISSIFSDFPITSIFGEYTKGHGLITFLNLILLFVVIINSSKEFILKIFKYIIISSILISLLAIKEYFFPSFSYGDLENRAFGTLGHPNYLSLYILVLIPLLLSNIIKNKYLKYGILGLLLIILILTKSIFAIFLAIVYIGFLIFLKTPSPFGYFPFIRGRQLLSISLFLLTILITYIIYKFGLLVKLNSFFSRFYIWETTLNIIFSDFKILFIGNGSDTLSYLFDSFKSKELYIFENIGFTADRPHNILLNIFYSFGLIGLFIFIYFIFNLTKDYLKNKDNKFIFHSIFLFLIFLFLNFSSIIVYFIILILLSYIYIKKGYNKINIFYLFPILLISILSILSSLIYYKEEILKANEPTLNLNFIHNKLILENPEKKLLSGKYSAEQACNSLLKIKTVENYFFCGNLLWNIDKITSINYYNLGLGLLPDMWDKDSVFYENIIIKNIFSDHRFYNEKYSNLKEILNRVNSK